MRNYFKAVPPGIIIGQPNRGLEYGLGDLDDPASQLYNFRMRNGLSILKNPIPWDYDVFFWSPSNDIPGFQILNVKTMFTDGRYPIAMHYVPAPFQLDELNGLVMWLRNRGLHVFHSDIFNPEYGQISTAA